MNHKSNNDINHPQKTFEQRQQQAYENPGVAVEFEWDEAEQLGACFEDALTEEEALEGWCDVSKDEKGVQ